MKVGKMRFPNGLETVGAIQDELAVPLSLTGGHFQTLSEILEANDPLSTIEFLIDQTAEKVPVADVVPLCAINAQEVWAAGVTYTAAAGADGGVGQAAALLRPGLRRRAAGAVLQGDAQPRGRPGEPVRIRKDAQWNVPEPELALVLIAPATRRLHDRQRHELARHRGREPALSAAGQGLRRLLRRWARGSRWRRHAAARRNQHSHVDPPGEADGFQGCTNVAKMARSFED